MRNLKAAALAVLAVGTGAGCALLTAPPASVANRTVLDEKAAIGAEVTYTAASRLGGRLAQYGLIDRAAYKSADSRAYAALLAVRSAYRAGNAASYAQALTDLNAAATAITGAVR